MNGLTVKLDNKAEIYNTSFLSAANPARSVAAHESWETYLCQITLECAEWLGTCPLKRVDRCSPGGPFGDEDLHCDSIHNSISQLFPPCNNTNNGMFGMMKTHDGLLTLQHDDTL